MMVSIEDIEIIEDRIKKTIDYIMCDLERIRAVSEAVLDNIYDDPAAMKYAEKLWKNNSKMCENIESLEEIVKRLEQERIIMIGDSLNNPFGGDF